MNKPIEVNPLWITLGVSLFRTLLTLAGFGAFVTNNPEAPAAIVGALVTIGTTAWGLYAWWSNHKAADVMANALPNSIAIASTEKK